MFDRIVRHLGATAGATFAVLGLLAGSVTAAETIKIGTFLAVTGPASFLGDPELKTLQMYIERINEEGGVLGRKLELVHYDSGGSPKKAVGFAKRLIEQDKVDIIVGASTTGSTLAIIPLVEKAGMPLISLAGSVKIIDPVKKWVFKTPHTDRMACAKIFEDMKKRGIAKVGMISGSGGFGKSMRGQCKSLAGEYGIEIVADETYGKKDTDMTVQLTKIKNAAGLQAVLNPGFGQGPAIVTKNYAQLGIKVPMYQSHGVASKGFIELAGAAAEAVAGRRPAEAGCARLQDRLREKVGFGRVDLRRPRLRRPVPGGRGDESRRQHRQGQGARRDREDHRLHRHRRRSEHVGGRSSGARPFGVPDAGNQEWNLETARLG